MQHTKGPWRFYKAHSADNTGGWDWAIVDSENKVIAESFEHVGRESSTVFDKRPAEANACLIAASPALLEACEAVLLVKCGCYSSVEDDWHSKNCLVPKLRAAVAQAKGE